ncbi:MAG: hypothetical protein M3235_10090, partial [Actinomycetota bacterium]|nr:hypothetical protein [Actinomycetota bacterium]
MSDVRLVVVQALHDTRDEGTAVLGDETGTVQWINFGADGLVVDVPDADKRRPGRITRLFGRSEPQQDGLGAERVRALEELGFTPTRNGHELALAPGALGHDQLVHVIVSAIGIVGIDGERMSVEV